MNPLVSILIPVFNRQNLIGECIDSALTQTFSDFEIIIVDNASEDETWNICQDYTRRDPRIRSFRNTENIGPVRNWMRCVQEARGEYSKILFSDDLLEPDCLRQMIERIQSHPDVGFVYCSARIGSQKENANLAYAFGDQLLNHKQFLDRILGGAAPVSPCAFLFRTTDVRRNLHADFPTTRSQAFSRHGAGPDVMISMLTSRDYPRVACINEPLVFFRAHDGSITINNANQQVTEGYDVIFAYFLKKYESWWFWMDYESIRWLKTIYHGGRLIPPRSFFMAREGTGSAIEMMFAFLFTLKHLGPLIIKLALSRNQKQSDR